MVKFVKVVKFVMDNRRTIGLIIGGTLTLAGFPEYGQFATNVGEM